MGGRPVPVAAFETHHIPHRKRPRRDLEKFDIGLYAAVVMANLFAER